MDKMTAEQALSKLLEANKAVNYMSIMHFIHNWLGGEDKVREIIAALSAPRVPAGWIIRRDNDGAIVVQKHGIGGYAAREMGESGIAESILYHLAEAMLAASPEPVADSEWIDIPANLRRQTNLEQHGQQVIDDLRQKYDTLLAKHQDVLDEVQLCGCAYDGPQDVCIGHAKVIDDLRAEVEALKAKNDALIDLSNGLDKMYRKLWKVIAQSVWQLEYRGEKDAVIRALRESISEAARLREGGA